MPSVMTGANLANRDLIYLGVSGDGDSASIGLGQFAHLIRRGVNMTYICENNGVYGLTKGQFSATADRGSKSKRGAVNRDAPIDMVSLALQLGITYVARSFSGDKDQLVPLIKGALSHRGAALLDVISPCVAFNNHAGSTKSYDYVREHNDAVNRLDFMSRREGIVGHVRARRGHRDHAARRQPACGCASSRTASIRATRWRRSATSTSTTRAARSSPACCTSTRRPTICTNTCNTVPTPLNRLVESDLCPGSAALERTQRRVRLNASDAF